MMSPGAAEGSLPAVVTGGTRGIGRAVARALAREGLPVVIVARDAARGENVARELGTDSGATVEFARADFSSLASTRALAASLLERYPRIGILVNNAGVYSLRVRRGADDLELTMTVNLLAPFLLTRLLLPAMHAGAPARVVNVASRVELAARNDFARERVWRRGSPLGFLSYARSKRGLMLLTGEFARRLDPAQVTVNTVHPGFVATDLLRDLPLWSRRLYEPLLTTPERAARTVVAVARATAHSGVTGAHFAPGPRLHRGSRGSRDAEAARALWEACSRMCDLPVELYFHHKG